MGKLLRLRFLIAVRLTMCQRGRRGFTLLEMLAALALSTIVISAVYGAVHLHWKIRASSEDQVQSARVLLGLQQDMTFDLRGVRQPEMELVDHADSLTDEASTTLLREPQFVAPTDITEHVLQFDRSEEVVELFDFYGQADWFVMTIAQPNPRFPDVASDSGRQIVWCVNSGRPLRVPYGVTCGTRSNGGAGRVGADHAERGATMGSLRYRSLEPRGIDRGLCRVLLPDAHAKMSRLDAFAESGQWGLIDRGTTGLHVRYFDGQQWHRAWNSHESQALPTAVEVTITGIETRSFVIAIGGGA